MHQAIAPLQHVLVRSRIGEAHALTFVPKGWIYNEKTIVFACDDYYSFAILQSNIHELWMRKYTSTLRTDINYSPTDCFDNFAFPTGPAASCQARAEQISQEYFEYRKRVMLARNLGLTKTYNLFHNSECRDQDIQRLRELHAEMDRAVLTCYGWHDIDPKHGFYQNERGHIRYTVSTEARREILRRLLDLNLSIAAKEGKR